MFTYFFNFYKKSLAQNLFYKNSSGDGKPVPPPIAGFYLADNGQNELTDNGSNFLSSN